MKGNELGKSRRPGLIISNDIFNAGTSALVIIIPLTRTLRGIPGHVEIEAGNGGLKAKSAALCEQIRCISQRRLIERWGRIVDHGTLREIESWLVDLLDLRL